MVLNNTLLKRTAITFIMQKHKKNNLPINKTNTRASSHLSRLNEQNTPFGKTVVKFRIVLFLQTCPEQ